MTSEKPENTENPAASGGTDSTEEPRIDDVLAADGDVSMATGDDDEESRRSSALDVREANLLAARRHQTVFVLAGGVACGKTSAYAALYERLGRGPFAGRLFAGSWTIPGFEERCHYWRESSNLPVPSMKHTQASDLPWLHLRLRDVSLESAAQDLLFGDFDGEFYDALIANEQQPSDLPFLRRADHVGVVLNGAKIADAATRQSECKDAQYLASQLRKDESHAPPSLMLVVTMIDIIEEVEDLEERARIETVISEVHKHIAAVTDGDVPIVRLAVRSASNRFPLGHGLEDLLEILKVRSATPIVTSPPPIVGTSTLTEFRA